MALTIRETNGQFIDRYSKVPVFEVSAGQGHQRFASFVYMCRLNLDLDGASNSYGLNNPAEGSLQKHLAPLEFWTPHQKKHAALKHVSTETSQKVGLANACGSPGDPPGTADKDKQKGHVNFLKGDRNFYWAGIKAVTKEEAARLKVTIDDRPELEAGLAHNYTHGNGVVAPVGSGWFPVVNPETGYYISGTSVASDGSLSTFDAHRYLDSTKVPYAVWANHWKTTRIGHSHVRQGDFGLAIENATGAHMAFVYGDSGTPNKVGECSQKLNFALGRGAGLVTFIAFPGSGPGSILGAAPENLIPTKVRTITQKLGGYESELAARLAMGRQLSSPGNSSMTAEQLRLNKNFSSALSAWT